MKKKKDQNYLHAVFLFIKIVADIEHVQEDQIFLHISVNIVPLCDGLDQECVSKNRTCDILIKESSSTHSAPLSGQCVGDFDCVGLG